MKALVVGYGSMGRRRIRLLRKICKDVEIICVDNCSERLQQINDGGFKGYSDIESALEKKPEIAFVCTSPGNHASIILRLVEHGIHVFTELNLIATDYDKIIRQAQEKNVVVFMSSTMLYDKRICSIDRLVKKEGKPLTYIYHVGQYLPDWHPWESYKDFFAGKKQTNGVREICAIQLPWLVNTFGMIESISVNRNKITGLDIDFCDSIMVSMQHENGNMGIFVADIVSRKATTYLEIIGEDIHLFWYGHNEDLYLFDLENKELKAVTGYAEEEHIEGYADNIIENRYFDEIQDFLDVIYKSATPKYSLEKDKYILSAIDKIEEKGVGHFLLPHLKTNIEELPV